MQNFSLKNKQNFGAVFSKKTENVIKRNFTNSSEIFKEVKPMKKYCAKATLDIIPDFYGTGYRLILDDPRNPMPITLDCLKSLKMLLTKQNISGIVEKMKSLDKLLDIFEK